MALKQNNQASFGSLLEKIRKDAGYSIERVVAESKIPKRYIEALECEKFDSLPPDVYVRGFITRYCKILSANGNKERLLRLYSGQSKFRNSREAGSAFQRTGSKPARKPIVIGPRHIGVLATALFTVFVFVYLAMNFIPYLFSPEVALLNPSRESLVVNFSEVTIAGRTKNTAQLTLNGKELYIGENGSFEDIFELREGVNILKFEAENILGNTNELVRRVVYIKNEN